MYFRKSIAIIVIALVFSGCSAGQQEAVCTWTKGKLTRADVKILAKDLDKNVQLQEALYRKLLPIHAKKYGYALAKKDSEREIDNYIRDFFGDEKTFEERLEKDKVSRKEVEREIIYQTLVDSFYSRYEINRNITDEESIAWYRSHTDLAKSGKNRDAYVYIFDDQKSALAVYQTLQKGARPLGQKRNVREYDDGVKLTKLVFAGKINTATKPVVTELGWTVTVPASAMKKAYRVSFQDSEQEILENIILVRENQKLHKELKKVAPKLDCKGTNPLDN